MGRLFVVRYMRYRGTYPAQKFVLDLPVPVQAKFLAYATYFANDGSLPSHAMGHYLDSPYQDIYEFKPGGWRIFAFRHERNLYLVSGAKKRNPKAQEGDYRNALNLRADFLNNLDKGPAR